MTPNDSGVRSSVRYQPDENPPKALSLGLGLQLAAISVAGVVLTPAIVTVHVDAPKPVRGGEDYQVIEEDN